MRAVVPTSSRLVPRVPSTIRYRIVGRGVAHVTPGR